MWLRKLSLLVILHFTSLLCLSPLACADLSSDFHFTHEEIDSRPSSPRILFENQSNHPSNVQQPLNARKYIKNTAELYDELADETKYGPLSVNFKEILSSICPPDGVNIPDNRLTFNFKNYQTYNSSAKEVFGGGFDNILPRFLGNYTRINRALISSFIAIFIGVSTLICSIIFRRNPLENWLAQETEEGKKKKLSFNLPRVRSSNIYTIFHKGYCRSLPLEDKDNKVVAKPLSGENTQTQHSVPMSASPVRVVNEENEERSQSSIEESYLAVKNRKKNSKRSIWSCSDMISIFTMISHLPFLPKRKISVFTFVLVLSVFVIFSLGGVVVLSLSISYWNSSIYGVKYIACSVLTSVNEVMNGYGNDSETLIQEAYATRDMYNNTAIVEPIVMEAKSEVVDEENIYYYKDIEQSEIGKRFFGLSPSMRLIKYVSLELNVNDESTVINLIQDIIRTVVNLFDTRSLLIDYFVYSITTMQLENTNPYQRGLKLLSTDPDSSGNSGEDPGVSPFTPQTCVLCDILPDTYRYFIKTLAQGAAGMVMMLRNVLEEYFINERDSITRAVEEISNINVTDIVPKLQSLANDFSQIDNTINSYRTLIHLILILLHTLVLLLCISLLVSLYILMKESLIPRSLIHVYNIFDMRRNDKMFINRTTLQDRIERENMLLLKKQNDITKSMVLLEERQIQNQLCLMCGEYNMDRNTIIKTKMNVTDKDIATKILASSSWFVKNHLSPFLLTNSSLSKKPRVLNRGLDPEYYQNNFSSVFANYYCDDENAAEEQEEQEHLSTGNDYTLIPQDRDGGLNESNDSQTLPPLFENTVKDEITNNAPGEVARSVSLGSDTLNAIIDSLYSLNHSKRFDDLFVKDLIPEDVLSSPSQVLLRREDSIGENSDREQKEKKRKTYGNEHRFGRPLESVSERGSKGTEGLRRRGGKNIQRASKEVKRESSESDSSDVSEEDLYLGQFAADESVESGSASHSPLDINSHYSLARNLPPISLRPSETSLIAEKKSPPLKHTLPPVISSPPLSHQRNLLSHAQEAHASFVDLLEESEPHPPRKSEKRVQIHSPVKVIPIANTNTFSLSSVGDNREYPFPAVDASSETTRRGNDETESAGEGNNDVEIELEDIDFIKQKKKRHRFLIRNKNRSRIRSFIQVIGAFLLFFCCFFLFFGGIIMFLVNPFFEICNYISDIALTKEESLQHIDDVIDGAIRFFNLQPLEESYRTMVVSLATTCVATDGDGNLWDALGIMDVLNISSQVDGYLNTLTNLDSTLSTINPSFLRFRIFDAFDDLSPIILPKIDWDIDEVVDDSLLFSTPPQASNPLVSPQAPAYHSDRFARSTATSNEDKVAIRDYSPEFLAMRNGDLEEPTPLYPLPPVAVEKMSGDAPLWNAENTEKRKTFFQGDSGRPDTVVMFSTLYKEDTSVRSPAAKEEIVLRWMENLKGSTGTYEDIQKKYLDIFTSETIFPVMETWRYDTFAGLDPKMKNERVSAKEMDQRIWGDDNLQGRSLAVNSRGDVSIATEAQKVHERTDASAGRREGQSRGHLGDMNGLTGFNDVPLKLPGLERAEEVIYPYWLSSLRPDGTFPSHDPTGLYKLTGDRFNVYSNNTFVLEINSFGEQRAASKNLAGEEKARDIQQFFNSVVWMISKERLRTSDSFLCFLPTFQSAKPKSDTSLSNNEGAGSADTRSINSRKCNLSEFQADLKNNHVDRVIAETTTTFDSIIQLSQSSTVTLKPAVKGLVLAIEELLKGMSCKFLSRGVVRVFNSFCGVFVYNINFVGVMWISAGVCFLFLLFSGAILLHFTRLEAVSVLKKRSSRSRIQVKIHAIEMGKKENQNTIQQFSNPPK